MIDGRKFVVRVVECEKELMAERLRRRPPEDVK